MSFQHLLWYALVTQSACSAPLKRPRPIGTSFLLQNKQWPTIVPGETVDYLALAPAYKPVSDQNILVGIIMGYP